MRYTQTGGVLLGVRRTQGGLRIEVHDSGPGIERVDQRAIFEEFRRGEGASGQGLGLGLSIADRIARLLRAPLSLRSRIGRGASFGVALPVVHPARPVEQSSRTKAGLSGRSVLVVDNDAGALEALRQVLAGWGCLVSAARDGTEAAAALARQVIDLWLFDFHLDEGDSGVAVAQRLSREYGARPCLILSADQNDGVRRLVQDAELPLLAKPVRPLALKSVLDRLLAARAAESPMRSEEEV